MEIHWDFAASALRPALKMASSRSLPQIEGRIYFEGLDSDVVVHRDRWGLARIQAGSRHDLFFSQGLVHAQDRLWQMEINRRAANGKLSEIAGERTLQTDRLTRTLGFNRLADIAWSNTSDKVRADVEAYTAGINAYINLNRPLPIEFRLLNIRPEPWSVLDSVAFGRLMAWSLSHVWAAKLLRSQLIESLGADLAAELEPRYRSDTPITLPQGIEFNLLEPDGMYKEAKGPFIGQAMKGGARGSNGWVLSPKLSATGNTLLCNDMHLPLTSPSLWYFMDLHCQCDEGEVHVTGVTLPGIPYVLVGRNDKIAWGATVSFVDNEDLFIEKFDCNDRSRYEYRGRWRPTQQIEERIQIKGREVHVEHVTITHHGPLISQIYPANGLALSLQSMALQPVESFAGIAMLNEASHWDEFVVAIRNIESPALNFLYADLEGNIGYFLSGRVPVRAKGKGQIPQPGWNGDYEWIGEIPFEEMPHALNPNQGFIVSANHRIITDDYPHYLGRSWRNGFRARRIEEFISTKGKITIEDCRKLQMDFISIPGLELVRRLGDFEAENDEAAQLLNRLQGWDGWLGPDSVGGCVYSVLLGRLAQAILIPKLGPKLSEQLLGVGPDSILHPANALHGHWPAILLRLLDNPESKWLPQGSERNHFIQSCLVETAVELRRLLGDDINNWRWGRLHLICFDHTFSSQPPLDRIFSHGPIPVGGDSDTVSQFAVIRGEPGDNIAPSYRQIIDLGDSQNGVAMHPPGQSGQVASLHYGDLLQPWLEGRYYPMRIDIATDQADIKRLTLSPALRAEKLDSRTKEDV